MVAFIAPETENILDNLRERMLRNSMDIIRLFSERIEISREIARVKSASGMDLRVRERELDIMRKMDLGDSVLNSILSSLFEFSIRSQESFRGIPANCTTPAEIALSGDREGLLWILGSLVSKPGIEFYATSRIPDAMALSVQHSGGHIVNAEGPTDSVKICLGTSGMDCWAELRDSNLLVIRNLESLSAPFKRYRIVTS